MMKFHSRKLLYAGCAFLVFIIFFLTLYLPVQPAGKVLEQGWQIKGSDKPIPIALPYQKSVTGLEVVVFTNQIAYSSGEALILSWPRGQAVKVLLNEQLIFAVGDLTQPTANIWNKTFLIQLPEPSLEKNSLEIYLASASFPINFSIPPYIVDFNQAQWRVALIDFFYNNILLVSIGSAALIGFILITLSLMRKKRWSAEIFMGMASILVAVESFDYVFRIASGDLTWFLISKKILMICGYLACLSFVSGLEMYYRGRLRISKYLAIPTLVSILLIAFQSDLVNFVNLITFVNIILLIELIIAISLILAGHRGEDWLVMPAVLLGLSLLQMILVQVYHFAWPYVMQYMVIFSTMIFGINLLLEYSNIFTERMILEQQAKLDALTTAYNRHVLKKADAHGYAVLILMDLDNFKYFNDRYGHPEGDKLLITFAEIVKSNLRQEDLVVRYGGDEFLVLLGKISLQDAGQVAMRIRSQFEAVVPDDKISVSYGIEKIDQSLETGLHKADRSMYGMKQSKQLHNSHS